MVIVVIFRVVGDFLDVHPAFGRDDHAASGAVNHQRKVVFLSDINAIGHVEAVDLLGFTGLHGDQGVAEHFLSEAFDFLDALGEAHAALGVGRQFLELALAAAAGVDLRLDDIERPGSAWPQPPLLRP
jgi:hypothetical protein